MVERYGVWRWLAIIGFVEGHNAFRNMGLSGLLVGVSVEARLD
jgi:hypothetical protein